MSKNKNIMPEYSPIALFVFNRPEHAEKTITALQNNIYTDKSDLYIFSDAAKKESDIGLVKEVRKYITTVNGFKSLNIIERDINMGLSKSIITGVTEICDKYGKVIVLEDDHVTSPYFLQYMNDGLRAYEHDEDVISIHGYIYPIENTLPETFFIRGADCWGWATWKTSWELYEEDGNKLLNEIDEKNLATDFNFDNAFDYRQMLKDQIAGRNDSWAVRWYASAYLKNKLTLYPGRTLISNIGNDSSGTHLKSTIDFDNKLTELPITVDKIPLKEDGAVRRQISIFFKKMKKTLIEKIIYRLSMFI